MLIYHSIALSRPVFLSLSKAEVDQNAEPCMIHNTDLNSPLFPLPLLYCSSVTAAPPLNFLSLSPSLFLSSVQLSFSSK